MVFVGDVQFAVVWALKVSGYRDFFHLSRVLSLSEEKFQSAVCEYCFLKIMSSVQAVIIDKLYEVLSCVQVCISL